MHEHDIDRRTFVRWAGTATGTLSLAGCLGFGDDEDEREDDSAENEEPELPPFPEVEDPPDAVYLPTHRESMRVLEPIDAGEYTIGPMLSYPHPFWLVTGDSGEDEVQRVDPERSRGVHLMITVWDAETGLILPVDDGNTVTVSLDGERVGSPQSPWAMISQEMGFHFGDNVPLEDDGTYTVEVELQPLSVRTTGDLEGRFTERETATFEFEFDSGFQAQVTDGVEFLDEDEWGDLGALEPMGHGGGHDGDDGHRDHDGIPYSALPAAEEYPGARLEPTGDSVDDDGLPRSGDAAVVATLLEAGSRLADGDDRYLLVSPRTPYNRVPLADMSLRATIERDGETVADGDGTVLEQTIDHEYDLHYGASIADARAGDSVAITIESPPRVARHQGYETAFLEMPPIELRVPE